MSAANLLLTLGVGLLGLLGYVIASVIGEAAVGTLKDAVFRGQTLTIRRRRNRFFLVTGGVCGVVSAMSALFGLAAATNGAPESADDARWLFAGAGLALMLAVVLMAEWWRRSVKP